MLIVRTVADLRAALSDRAGSSAPARVGLVPTMGALHDGHLSLLRAARAECTTVVMSLFVNPRQFDAGSDLAAYPRDEDRDAALAAQEGVDVLFAPDAAAVYPPGFATTVSVAGPAEGLEGTHRGRAHFDGVVTVVLKLLNMVGPDVAYFGQKDAQQTVVVRRLVLDLDLPVEIRVRPTVRAASGLALSSRNVRLDPSERDRAAVLHHALQRTAAALGAGQTDPGEATRAGRAALAAAGAELEYLEVVDPVSMASLRRVTGDALIVVAARIGDVRLIDNLAFPVRVPETQVATPAGAPTTQ